LQLIVNIDVDDLDRAIDFYTAAFDFRCERRLFEGSVAELIGASSKIHLLFKPTGTRASSGTNEVRHYARHWTPVHLDFEVSDIATAVARAVMAGATLERDVQDFVWGQHAELRDPFGHGVCLVRFSPQGYAAVR